MSVIDANSRGIGKGVQTDRENVAIPLSINPANGKLRMEIVPRSIGLSNVPNRMPIDANSYNVAGALTNDSDKTLTPLSVDLILGTPCLRIEII